jgi:hypothetical protein
LKRDDYWILTSFNIKNPNKSYKSRQILWDLSCSGRLKNISKCFYKKILINRWEYFNDVIRRKFVYSPFGFGIDCYRTWEVLYLGSIPILKNSTMISVFEQLPLLILDSYEQINLQFKKNIYHNMTNKAYDFKRLYKGYWQNKINHYRNCF